MKLDSTTTWRLACHQLRFQLRSWPLICLALAFGGQLAAVQGADRVAPTWRPWESLLATGQGIQAFRSEERVLFKVEQMPANGLLEFPRLNNVVRLVTLQSSHGDKPSSAESTTPGKMTLLKLTQDAKTWRIAVPKDCDLPADIELHVDGRPWQSDLPRIIEPSTDGALVLSAHDGETFGEKLQFEPLTHKNTVGYWVKPKDWAQWNAHVRTPGRYRVRILQGCGAGQGGSRVALSVRRKDGQNNTEDIAEVEFDVVATGHFQNFVWRDLGELSLPPGPVAVELRVRKLAKQAVMDVRQIRFEPIEVAKPSQPVSIADVQPDLIVPAFVSGKPQPGRRARQTADGYDPQHVYHALYLPTDWKPTGSYPVIVELTGNGEYLNALGDRCTGSVDDACLGFGISGGHGAIWLTLPFLNAEGTANVTKWWGTAPTYDAAATIKYWQQVLDDVAANHGGDEKRFVLTGFSRGALACNALGLGDDQIAKRWAAFICCSHYDGVRTDWPFAGANREQAAIRLARLGNRPQFVCSESASDLQATQDYLKSTAAPDTQFTFQATGFENHTDRWVLRPSETRQAVRAWLKQQLKAD